MLINLNSDRSNKHDYFYKSSVGLIYKISKRKLKSKDSIFSSITTLSHEFEIQKFFFCVEKIKLFLKLNNTTF